MANIMSKLHPLKIKNFIQYWIKETIRIVTLNRKPKKSEFYEVSRITGLGIIIYGFIGFIIFIIAYILRNL